MGIVAHKYNMKNQKAVKVIISLDSSLTKLIYKDANTLGAWKLFDDATAIQLSKFQDLIYGGTTENFKRHRRLLRRQKLLQQ